ncbi:ActS/PrrB/RegB family redox-sensitive histidine kinase [Rhodovibrionaceae bacterium A322]
MTPQITDSHVLSAEGAFQHGGRVRLRTLVNIRWVAIAGQLLSLLIIHSFFNFTIPLLEAAAVIGASAILNLVTAFGQRSTPWLDSAQATWYLSFDVIQLAVLLSLTGGLNNPFSLLLMAPVVVSASSLSHKSTILLSCLAILAATANYFWHLPLPWFEGTFELPQIYLAGVWVSIALAVVFISAYVSSLARESRRMEDALAASQLALAREQRLSSLGGLAAAAAHELGSPLGTIAVVVKEMQLDLPEDLPQDSPLREDLALLQEEADRCKKILSELATRPKEDSGDSPYNQLPLMGLLEATVTNLQRDGKALELIVDPDIPDEFDQQPVVQRSPEILHGVGTLIQNGLQFASSKVEVRLFWDANDIRVTIQDNGPGFDEHILNDLGSPYLSTGGKDSRGRDSMHMGLGVFIAKTLLAHSGAQITFSNVKQAGARVAITWPRERIESTRTTA